MKRFILLILVCSLFASIATGCADVAVSSFGADAVPGEEADYAAQVAQTAPMEEGYYMVEGTLLKIDKDSITLETEEGQVLHFDLAPETVIYSGENDEFVSGQRVRVVFDGDIGENGMEKVSVIAVTNAEA
ncbi:MAG: hypothetical protein Q4D94_00400 [Bacillota bacterium]|nr:hypothetical protein [Bacillota bacterium]